MNYLAIDTSGSRLTVAAKFGEKRVLRSRDDCKTGHAAFLMDEIDDALEMLETDVSKMDFIACVIGPGSFTGIRIGVATVKALCFAYNKPALALTSFDVLAYNDFESENKVCLINAMHGNFYVQAFRGFIPVSAPAFLSEGEIDEKYADYKKIADCDCETFNVKATDCAKCFVCAVEKEYLKAIESAESLSCGENGVRGAGFENGEPGAGFENGGHGKTGDETQNLKNKKLIGGDLLSPLYVKKSQAEEELCK